MTRITKPPYTDGSKAIKSRTGRGGYREGVWEGGGIFHKILASPPTFGGVKALLGSWVN